MKNVSIRQLNSVSAEQLARIFAGPAQQAEPWLATAAENGVTEAQLRYGQLLLEGIGRTPQPQQALMWFKLAAHSGHVMAMNMVGRCYENGWGIQIDQTVATYWFRLAAERKLDWGMYNYGTSLALGRGTCIDRAKAYYWFSSAARAGHIKSLNILGGFYEDGWEVQADLAIAETYYRRAAEGGDFRGQFNYARLLASQRNIAEAVRWMKRVPRTATPAFLAKTRAFLAQATHAELRELRI